MGEEENDEEEEDEEEKEEEKESRGGEREKEDSDVTNHKTTHGGSGKISFGAIIFLAIQSHDKLKKGYQNPEYVS